MSNYKITIPITEYSNQLRGFISSDLTALELIHSAVGKETYPSSVTIVSGLNFETLSTPPPEFLKQREINKCFKSILGYIQDYMDTLLAVIKYFDEKRFSSLNVKGLTVGEIKLAIAKEIDKLVMEISVNKRLGAAGKLSKLLDLPEHEAYRESLQSLIDIRNGIEHHKGIASIDRSIKYKKITIEASGKKLEPGGIINAGELVTAQIVLENINYNEGGVLLISQNLLNEIVISILYFIIPALENATRQKIKSSDIQASNQ